MRIALWHGYLLSDTGSNVFTRELARACARRGHNITLFCQDPRGASLVGPGVEVIRPAIGRALPVFVEDTYADFDARHVARFTPTELDGYIDSNAAAVRKIIETSGVDFLLANHAIMGGPVALRACAGSTAPYGVYLHGSELEYAIRGRPRLGALARAGVDEAFAVVSGSAHVERRTVELLGPGPYSQRFVRLSPGVDTEGFHPGRGSIDELVSLLVERAAVAPPGHDERLPDAAAPARLARVGRFALYVGKLTREKGVDLLLGAWRRVASSHPDVDLVVVGFGADRAVLEEQSLHGRVVFTGAMSHEQLQMLMPLAEVVVVPSRAPEAFGMIAAEAAACGVPPLVANHSGLAEVAEALGDAAFTTDGSEEDLAARLDAVLSLDKSERRRIGERARACAVRMWSWDKIARGLEEIAAGASPHRGAE